jgi:hypothetical protein
MATQTTLNNDINDINADVDGVDEELPRETKGAGEVDPEDRSSISQRYGKRCVTMGVAIIVLLSIVIGLVIYISVNNQANNQVGQNKGISHTSTIISAADGKGETTTIIYEEVMPGQSVPADEESTDENNNNNSEEIVQENGKINIPKKLINFIKNVVTTSPGSDGYRRLNIPKDMITRLNGNCEYWHMYEPAETTNEWQCNSKPQKQSFGYKPSDKIFRYLSEATDVSEDAIRSIQIGSGVADSEPGLWCSMPIPGSEY